MLPKSLQDVACWVQPGLCWPWTLFTQSCPTCRCKVVGWSASCWTGRKGNWRQSEIECWNAKKFCAHGRTFGMKSRTTATQSLQYVVIWRSSNSRARTHKPAIQHPSVFTCIRWWHADRSGEPLGWQWWFKVISKCGHWPCCSAMSFPHCEDQQHDVFWQPHLRKRHAWCMGLLCKCRLQEPPEHYETLWAVVSRQSRTFVTWSAWLSSCLNLAKMTSAFGLEITEQTSKNRGVAIVKSQNRTFERWTNWLWKQVACSDNIKVLRTNVVAPAPGIANLPGNSQNGRC